MKRSNLLAPLLCMALLAGLLLSGCNASGAVVGKVGKENITVKEVNTFADFILLQNGYTRQDIVSEEDMKDLNNTALDMAVFYKLMVQKATAMGFYPLTDEDSKSIDDMVTEYLDSRLQEYKDTYTSQAESDPAIDPDKAAQAALDEELKAQNLTKEDIAQILVYSKAAELVADESNKTVSVTDEEVRAHYDELLASQKESYDADALTFEDDMSSGQTIVYRLAGYRYVKHILIAYPEEIADQITAALESGDDEAVKTLREQGAAQIQARADEVLAKVQGNGDFDSLMAEYGEDPGMQTEPEMTAGYLLGSGTSFVEEFKTAALQLANAGDVTGLVATDFGYHIIKYVGDVAAGAVAYEEVQEALKTETLSAKQETNWDTLVEQWKTEAGVETYPDKMPVVVASPAATAAG